MINRTAILVILLACTCHLQAQPPAGVPDSSIASLAKLGPRYMEAISSKTDKYYTQVTGKTEKTLERLAKWESKIKTILEKTSPETAPAFICERSS